MTDDEIVAAIRPLITAGRYVPNDLAQAIYRAGMLRAAQIARERETALWHARRTSPFRGTYPEGLSDGAGDAVAAIERAAGGEG